MTHLSPSHLSKPWFKSLVHNTRHAITLFLSYILVFRAVILNFVSPFHNIFANICLTVGCRSWGECRENGVLCISGQRPGVSLHIHNA